MFKKFIAIRNNLLGIDSLSGQLKALSAGLDRRFDEQSSAVRAGLDAMNYQAGQALLRANAIEHRLDEQVSALRAGLDAINYQTGQALLRANAIELRLDEKASVAQKQTNKPSLDASHAAIFRKFRPCTTDAPPGFNIEYGGNIVSKDILTPSFSLTNEGYPAPSEELFEWVDLLESIDDAGDSYVMAELGAGFARWLGAAACLMRQYKPMPFRLIGVEAEPTHFEWIKKYFQDNGVDWREHHFVQAAVGGSDGVARFVIGNPREWYGQAVEQRLTERSDYAMFSDAHTVEVPMISLETLLKNETKVDFIHMDIQGSEGAVIASSHRTLSDKVKRLHVATHNSDVERLVYDTLRREGWFCTASYPSNTTTDTPYGTITFADGVQTWINRRLF